MKTKLLIAYLFFSFCRLQAQQTGTLTLEQCYKLAKDNYPLLKQMVLIERTKEYSVDNAAKGYLPQLSFNGQATYQSDVTKIPISLPGISVPELSKDQYKVYGEINQSLTDAFVIKQQKELVKSQSVAEEQKLEAELYKLRERVNQLYFGILLVQAQLQQAGLLKKDIESAIDKINAAITNGAGMKSDADLMNAELLKAEQKITELEHNRKGFTDMLSVFINQPLSETVYLQVPPAAQTSETINRPELKMYEAQKRMLDVQSQLITSRNIPRVNLFLQAGYGRPALNMLDNTFKFYYIAGARLNWNISGFYTYKKDRQLLGISQAQADVQKETFVFNTNLQLKQQNSELEKLQQLINSDQAIISLREKVKSAAAAKLENGTLSSTDYLTYINAEDQARQNLSLHQVQLLLAQYNYQVTSGN